MEKKINFKLRGILLCIFSVVFAIFVVYASPNFQWDKYAAFFFMLVIAQFMSGIVMIKYNKTADDYLNSFMPWNKKKKNVEENSEELFIIDREKHI
ncbi:hypothetical protein [Clostridium lundense]|uniref:hypothetical protein n=1 Tax=Clostridium lundense TaxID=319475 RepID=UPI00048202F4|nr:hypothetical protein [Clostridium lundense]